MSTTEQPMTPGFEVDPSAFRHLADAQVNVELDTAFSVAGTLATKVVSIDIDKVVLWAMELRPELQSARLTHPEYRADATVPRRRAGWDETLDFVADRFAFSTSLRAMLESYEALANGVTVTVGAVRSSVATV